MSNKELEAYLWRTNYVLRSSNGPWVMDLIKLLPPKTRNAILLEILNMACGMILGKITIVPGLNAFGVQAEPVTAPVEPSDQARFDSNAEEY